LVDKSKNDTVNKDYFGRVGEGKTSLFSHQKYNHVYRDLRIVKGWIQLFATKSGNLRFFQLSLFGHQTVSVI